jgi:hypothetical protein
LQGGSSARLRGRGSRFGSRNDPRRAVAGGGEGVSEVAQHGQARGREKLAQAPCVDGGAAPAQVVVQLDLRLLRRAPHFPHSAPDPQHLHHPVPIAVAQPERRPHFHPRRAPNPQDRRVAGQATDRRSRIRQANRGSKTPTQRPRGTQPRENTQPQSLGGNLNGARRNREPPQDLREGDQPIGAACVHSQTKPSRGTNHSLTPGAPVRFLRRRRNPQVHQGNAQLSRIPPAFALINLAS